MLVYVNSLKFASPSSSTFILYFLLRCFFFRLFLISFWKFFFHFCLCLSVRSAVNYNRFAFIYLYISNACECVCVWLCVSAVAFVVVVLVYFPLCFCLFLQRMVFDNEVRDFNLEYILKQ